MSRWYIDGEDPFSKVGFARVVVVKHKPQHNWRGEERENCTQIMHVEAFQLGFLSPEIKKSKYGTGPSPWITDAVRDDSEHKINHIFKTLPEGIYELIGEVWHWSSVSYEGEWNGDTELRETKIQEISFDHAVALGNERWFDEMRALLPHREYVDQYYMNDYDIHPYMTIKQILRNQANALTSIINMNTYNYRTNYSDSSIEELESCIHMMMLQIDSEKHLAHADAIKIDMIVQETIRDHRTLMDPEF